MAGRILPNTPQQTTPKLNLKQKLDLFTQENKQNLLPLIKKNIISAQRQNRFNVNLFINYLFKPFAKKYPNAEKNVISLLSLANEILNPKNKIKVFGHDNVQKLIRVTHSSPVLNLYLELLISSLKQQRKLLQSRLCFKFNFWAVSKEPNLQIRSEMIDIMYKHVIHAFTNKMIKLNHFLSTINHGILYKLISKQYASILLEKVFGKVFSSSEEFFAALNKVGKTDCLEEEKSIAEKAKSLSEFLFGKLEEVEKPVQEQKAELTKESIEPIVTMDNKPQLFVTILDSEDEDDELEYESKDYNILETFLEEFKAAGGFSLADPNTLSTSSDDEMHSIPLEEVNALLKEINEVNVESFSVEGRDHSNDEPLPLVNKIFPPAKERSSKNYLSHVSASPFHYGPEVFELPPTPPAVVMQPNIPLTNRHQATSNSQGRHSPTLFRPVPAHPAFGAGSQYTPLPHLMNQGMFHPLDVRSLQMQQVRAEQGKIFGRGKAAV